MQFTKEVKQKWIDALESGKYHQHQVSYGDPYKSGNKKCCLNVLDTVACEMNGNKPQNAWKALEDANEKGIIGTLVMINDADLKEDQKLDYSNVLPLICELKTVD